MTEKQTQRVLRAGHGQNFENPRKKPARPVPRLSPPKPHPDAHTLRAVPDRKKELAND
ncbi:MAG: hypothetical protein GXY15_01490 [Candidatus Hydrogenedentes bacterium]|mgnify:CR=1 FL=1|nr:hypothetical protein [Candidatus Hydrogenedentota bacterium]